VNCPLCGQDWNDYAYRPSKYIKCKACRAEKNRQIQEFEKTFMAYQASERRPLSPAEIAEARRIVKEL